MHYLAARAAFLKLLHDPTEEEKAIALEAFDKTAVAAMARLNDAIYDLWEQVLKEIGVK